jgi:hypothetical protein
MRVSSGADVLNVTTWQGGGDVSDASGAARDIRAL